MHYLPFTLILLALSQYRIPSPIQSPAVSRRNSQVGHEVYEVYDTFTQSHPQRQQRHQPLRIHSRPSSSSGSTRTLRRTPKFEEQIIPRGRASSNPTPLRRNLDPRAIPAPAPVPEQLDTQLSEEGDSSTTPRANRDPSPEASYWPRRSTRISRRTHSAILYTLEEAIRTPKQFTPDLAEENALMSDLAGGGPIGSTSNGRAQNGGSRPSGGPVPVSQNPTTRAMTPREVMRQRTDREARKRANAENEARQRVQEADEEERIRENARLSAERRETAGVAGASEIRGEASGNRRSRGQSAARISAGDLPPPQDLGGERRRSDRTGSGTTGRVNPPVETYVPTGPRTQESSTTRPLAEGSSLPQPVSSRVRGSSVSQTQPKPVQPQTSRAASAPYSTQRPASQTRQASAGAGTTQAQQGPSAAPSASQRAQPTQSSRSEPSRNPTTSSFPHAFERWETLSSHWEGLTAYWIRRLKGNTDEREPLNQQLARQVTDLSAAGANLFHAVVELQRLRASSERKFQRWFFETRTEQENLREKLAAMELKLRTEKQARADIASNTTLIETERASAEQVKAAAEQRVFNSDLALKEMKRELQISKDEARRAWEELGRREQEERDRTASLRSGEPTLVGGVQVVPMLQGAASRQPSVTRPPARDGPLPGDTGGLTGNPTRPRPEAFVESPREGEVGYTNYDPTRSETDTDPFTEGGRESSRQGIPDVPPLPSSIGPSHQQASSSSSTAVQSGRGGTTGFSEPPQISGVPAPSSGTGGTYLKYGPAGATAQPPSQGSFYQHPDTALLSEQTTRPQNSEGDERSYVPSAEDTFSEEEYEIDERGEYRTDVHGNRLLYRRGPASDDSEEYVQDQLEQEQINRSRYAVPISGVEYGHGPTATAGVSRPPGGVFDAVPGVGLTRYEPQGQVDYSGSGYGPGWEAVPRHHHPTRLSDVLEEDERSRTSPSRQSQGSRGLH